MATGAAAEAGGNKRGEGDSSAKAKMVAILLWGQSLQGNMRYNYNVSSALKEDAMPKREEVS